MVDAQKPNHEVNAVISVTRWRSMSGALESGGVVDLRQVATYPFPAEVIGRILGIPPADQQRFQGWAADVVAFVGAGQPDRRVLTSLADSIGPLYELIGFLAGQRRQSPRDDLLSAMVQAVDDEDGSRLSEVELVANSLFLMTAGHETATNLLSNGVVTLLRHRQQAELMTREPDVVTTGVEEILRYASPVQVTARRAVEPLHVAGRSVQPGESAICVLGAANRDPLRFPDPDRFDVRRLENTHLAFAFGTHFCLGASLAREEARIFLPALLRRFPGMELAGTPLEWQQTLDFRGPLRLEVVPGTPAAVR